MEVCSGYRLHHGEAVAIDMALSCALAVEFGLLGADDYERILAVFEALRLPTHAAVCTIEILEDALAEVTKHRAGSLNLVLPTTIGTATFITEREQITGEVLLSALQRLRGARSRALSPASAYVGLSG